MRSLKEKVLRKTEERASSEPWQRDGATVRQEENQKSMSQSQGKKRFPGGCVWLCQQPSKQQIREERSQVQQCKDCGRPKQKGVLYIGEIEGRLESGEDLIRRNKKVIISNITFNMFNRKMQRNWAIRLRFCFYFTMVQVVFIGMIQKKVWEVEEQITVHKEEGIKSREKQKDLYLIGGGIFPSL